MVYQAASGERYYLEKSFRLDAGGLASVTLKAENPGLKGNMAAGEKLSIVSAIPAGIDSEAVVSGAGITGGNNPGGVMGVGRALRASEFAPP